MSYELFKLFLQKLVSLQKLQISLQFQHGDDKHDFGAPQSHKDLNDLDLFGTLHDKPSPDQAGTVSGSSRKYRLEHHLKKINFIFYFKETNSGFKCSIYNDL